MCKTAIILVILCLGNINMAHSMQSVAQFVKKNIRAIINKNKQRAYTTQRKPSYGFIWTPYDKTLYAGATIPHQTYAKDSIEHHLIERYIQKIKRTPLAGMLATTLPMSCEKRSLLGWLRLSTRSDYHQELKTYVAMCENEIEHPVESEGIATYINVLDYQESFVDETKQWPLIRMQHGINPVFVMCDEPFEVTKNSIMQYDTKASKYTSYVLHPLATHVSLKEYYMFLDHLNPRLSRDCSSLTPSEAMVINAACKQLLVNALVPNTFEHALRSMLKK